MQNPDRELLLQNSLAMGATLLFRAGTVLGKPGKEAEQCLLLSEIASWFSETKNSLSGALALERRRDIPTFAPTAATSGGESTFQPWGSIQLSAGPANSTEMNTTEGEVSSPQFSGGTPIPVPTSPELGLNSPPSSNDTNCSPAADKSLGIIRFVVVAELSVTSLDHYSAADFDEAANNMANYINQGDTTLLETLDACENVSFTTFGFERKA